MNESAEWFNSSCDSDHQCLVGHALPTHATVVSIMSTVRTILSFTSHKELSLVPLLSDVWHKVFFQRTSLKLQIPLTVTCVLGSAFGLLIIHFSENY
jgi:hypothetical protein